MRVRDDRTTALVAQLGQVAHELLEPLKEREPRLYYRLRAAAWILAHPKAPRREIRRLVADDLSL